MSSEDHQVTYIYIIFLITLVAFIVVGGWMESKHLQLGHETGFIIVFGMIVSWIVARSDSEEEADRLVFQFNTTVFFDLALPAILFAAGYNMRRKEFFRNFTNIVKFGIFGSLFTFIVFVALTWCLFNQPWFDIDVWHPDTKSTEPFQLDLLEIMLVCSILVSSDIIAAMAILNFNEQPHIFSIILGEGLFNDVVVIVLYQTVVDYKENEGE